MTKLSNDRDILRWKVEDKAKEPFLKAYKGDLHNLQLTVDYTVWNSVDNLEKAAYSFHSDIKNFWKWVKKGLVESNADESSVKQYLFNVVYFFVSDNKEELAKWKTALLAGSKMYYPLCF